MGALAPLADNKVCFPEHHKARGGRWDASSKSIGFSAEEEANDGEDKSNATVKSQAPREETIWNQKRVAKFLRQ